MSKEAYEHIAAGLKDAIRYLEGNAEVRATYRVHKFTKEGLRIEEDRDTIK